MIALLCAAAVAVGSPARASWEKEVLYQIFPNSFRDSNGDRVGDFKGIESKLGYLQSLGVTAILINPIFKSPFYHRYFADDFMTADPVLGTNADFFHLIRTAHAVTSPISTITMTISIMENPLRSRLARPVLVRISRLRPIGQLMVLRGVPPPHTYS